MRVFVVFLWLSIVLSACTQRMICPAFQSAYIYDQEALRKKFSYFKEDSTPKVLTASKTKYLIAEDVPFPKKVRSMKTVEMKDVNPVLPDSLNGDEDKVTEEELKKAAQSIIDSVVIVRRPPADTLQQEEDSVYVITKDKEVRLLLYNPDSLKYRVEERGYNIDQDNYMWYLRDVLVLPDVRLAKLHNKEKKKEEKKSEKKKKKKERKGLFKKRKKESVDTTTQVVEKSEYDLEFEENEPKPDSTQQTKKKRGLFRKKDKSSKATGGPTTANPAEDGSGNKRKKKKNTTEPAPVEKKEDDGF